jgi:TDG/mug DNA glycosylase family protein
MPQSFAPLEPAQAKILILGSMPSVRSLEKQQYYGHPQNQFWPLLFGLWELPVPGNYGARVEFLLQRCIALWDVLSSCDRQGSLDAAIRNPLPNAIAPLLARQPQIRFIFFNGAKAWDLFRRLLLADMPKGLGYCTLPSSSPARAMRFEEKLALWSPVRRAAEGMV